MNRRRNILKNTGAGILFVLILLSCVEFEPVSDIPEITYKELNVIRVYDSLQLDSVVEIELSFDFIDGDADIGIYIDDTQNESLPDSSRYNFFITLFDKIDGAYKERILTIWNSDSGYFDTLYLHQTILYDDKLNRVGQNKTVKGNMKHYIKIYDPSQLKDTARLEFYIQDRAYHRSNLEHTDDFILNQ